MIPNEDLEVMLEYYDEKESRHSIESEMNDNGVTWSDFI